MTITFYLNQDRKHNLYCRVSDGKERSIFSLGYAVAPSSWDSINETLSENDPHYYTLLRLKNELEGMAYSLKEEGKEGVVDIIKDYVLEMTKENGIDSIDKEIFNNNKSLDVPDYDSFMMAFEKATGNKAKDYMVEIEKNRIHLYSNTESYTIDSEESAAADIFEFIYNEWYEGLTVKFSVDVWDKLFQKYKSDLEKPLPQKAVLLPKVYGKWREYWDQYSYNHHEDDPNRIILKEFKEESWRHLMVFLQSYDDKFSPILIANELGPELCISVILAMAEFFNEEQCILDYCKLYFEIKCKEDENFKKVSVNNKVLYVIED